MPEVWPDETDGSTALVFQDPGVVPSSVISQLYLWSSPNKRTIHLRQGQVSTQPLPQ
jgi:hypothetical protein